MIHQKIWQWIKSHKLAAIFISLSVLVIIAVIMALSVFYLFAGGTASRKAFYPYETAISSPLPASDHELSFLERGLLAPGQEFFQKDLAESPLAEPGPSEIEIREGKIEVKSESADNDFEKLKTFVSQEQGYIESSKKRESRTYLAINAQVRIPVQNFEKFVEEISGNFEVKSFELKDYRIDVQRQVDELDIIWQAIEDYNQIREKTLAFETSRDQIELLRIITERLQSLARQQSQIERDLGGKRRQADLATINIAFSQRLKSDLWPEDLGHLFRDRLSWAIETVSTTFANLLLNSLVLLVKVIEYVAYLLVVALPLMVVWSLIKRFKKRFKNKQG